MLNVSEEKLVQEDSKKLLNHLKSETNLNADVAQKPSS